MLELIQTSPSAHFLLPLTMAPEPAPAEDIAKRDQQQ